MKYSSPNPISTQYASGRRGFCFLYGFFLRFWTGWNSIHIGERGGRVNKYYSIKVF